MERKLAFLIALLALPSSCGAVLAQSDAGPLHKPAVLSATPSGNGPDSNLIVPETGGSNGILLDPATTPRPQAPSPSPRPATAQPAAAQPAANGEKPTVTAYADWSTECFAKPVQGVKCQIAHRVTAGQGHQVVLAISIAKASSGQDRIQMAFPLGLSLGAGVRLDIAGAYQADLPLNRCTGQGCLIEGVISDDMLAAMNKATTGSATVWTEAGAPVKLPFSLRGFTDAYAAMSTANVAAATGN